MGKRVLVAYEAPSRGSNRYMGDVRRALAKMGGGKELDQDVAERQHEYVKKMQQSGVPAVTTAALIFGHRHAHAVVGIAAEEVHRAVPVASEPVAPQNVVGGPFWLVNGGKSAREVARHEGLIEARDSAAFSQITKDTARFNAAMARAKLIGPLDNDRQLHRFLRNDLESQDQEIFVVVGLDLNNALRTYAEVARGQRDRVAVLPADIMRPILVDGCVAFACAHNHPSGSPEPSEQDRRLTETLRQAAKPYEPGIVFLDHLVIGSAGSYYSFADRKLKRG